MRAAFAKWTEPAESGLPRWPVLLGFPAASTIVFLVIVVLGLTGSSTGVFWAALGEGPDPRLIAGVPRDIRIDEWLNQTSWIISQASQGFPAVNHTFPGGMDATVLSNLPNTDWSNYFRPHLLASLVLPLDQGIAWRWWLPGLALVVSCYVFAVSLMPRRPVTAAMLSVALFFTPIIQWWWHPDSIWPPAWSLLALAAIVWCVRDRRLWVRIVWSAIVGYLAVCTAMGGYLPYIVPLLHVVLLVGLGLVVTTLTEVTPARPLAFGVVAVPLGLLAILVVIFRLVAEPGLGVGASDREVAVEWPAFAGLVGSIAIVVGAWIALADERTGTALSRAQTERALAVRGAPRAVPPPKDPS